MDNAMEQADGTLPTTLTNSEVEGLLFSVMAGIMTASQAKAEHHRINALRRGKEASNAG